MTARRPDRPETATRLPLTAGVTRRAASIAVAATGRSNVRRNDVAIDAASAAPAASIRPVVAARVTNAARATARHRTAGGRQGARGDADHVIRAGGPVARRAGRSGSCRQRSRPARPRSAGSTLSAAATLVGSIASLKWIGTPARRSVPAEIDRKASSGQRADRGRGWGRRDGSRPGESERRDGDDDPDGSEEDDSGGDRPPGKHRQVEDREDGDGQSRGGDFAQYDSLLLGSLGDETPSRGAVGRDVSGATAVTLARGRRRRANHGVRATAARRDGPEPLARGGRTRPCRRSGCRRGEPAGCPVAAVGRRREAAHLEEGDGAEDRRGLVTGRASRARRSTPCPAIEGARRPRRAVAPSSTSCRCQRRPRGRVPAAPGPPRDPDRGPRAAPGCRSTSRTTPGNSRRQARQPADARLVDRSRHDVAVATLAERPVRR